MLYRSIFLGAFWIGSCFAMKIEIEEKGAFSKIKLFFTMLFIRLFGDKRSVYLDLKHAAIFKRLTHGQLSNIVNTVRVVNYKQGDLIFKKGDPGDFLYYIKKGAVIIYATPEQTTTEIVLARLNQGDYFGEQALLEEAPGVRLASAKAVEECECYTISHADYLHVLNADLKGTLQKIGEKELTELFFETETHLGITKIQDLKKLPGEIVKYKAGDIIFKTNDISEAVYFIVSGSVCVEIEREGRKSKTELGLGCIFGELGVIHKAPRSATALAKEDVTLMVFQGQTFMTLYNSSEELRNYTRSLKYIYVSSNNCIGSVQIYFSNLFSANAITALYTLENGLKVRSIKAIGSLAFMMGYTDTPEVGIVHFARGAEVRRKLGIQNHKIMSVSSFGEWRELGEICSLILNANPISDDQIKSFQRIGELGVKKLVVIKDEDGGEILCNCMNVSKGRVYEEVQKGVNDLQEIVRNTGAGSVCGTCRPKIIELLGLKAWTTVKLTKRIILNPHVCACTFQLVNPSSDCGLEFLPGQYVVISALIQNNFINRSYTITSCNKDSVEIIVKKEDKGYFSSWLFNEADENALFRISYAQGGFTLEDNTTQPIIFFVGGIGVTPAIAYARHFIATHSSRILHVDYSVSKREDFILLDEWADIAAKNKNITTQLRVSSEQGRLQVMHIKEIANKMPDSAFRICGPKNYETFVLDTLVNLKIPMSRIKTEEFVHAGSPANKTISM